MTGCRARGAAGRSDHRASGTVDREPERGPAPGGPELVRHMPVLVGAVPRRFETARPDSGGGGLGGATDVAR